MLSIVLVAVALVAALVSAISVWFSVSIPNTATGTVSGSYSIIDVYKVISQFVGAFANHGSLPTNINSAPTGAIVLLLVIYLGASSTYFVPIFAGMIFLLWPLVILTGLVALAKRGLAYVSGILAVSLFIFAFGLVAKLGSVLSSPPSSRLLSSFPPGGTISLGYGPYILLVAGILFLAAPLVGRLAGRRRQPQPGPAIPSTSPVGSR
jgi:hypothetical protein